jgi:hypothetical protein
MKMSFVTIRLPKSAAPAVMYAAKSAEQLAGLGLRLHGICGEVHLWGTIIEHSHGWRRSSPIPRVSYYRHTQLDATSSGDGFVPHKRVLTRQGAPMKSQRKIVLGSVLLAAAPSAQNAPKVSGPVTAVSDSATAPTKNPPVEWVFGFPIHQGLWRAHVA